MQDLKTGHLIRASPRAQFFGQLIGSCLSIVVTTTAYSLYQRAYPIPGPSFPAPTAYVWLGLARLLRTSRLPLSRAGRRIGPRAAERGPECDRALPVSSADFKFLSLCARCGHHRRW